MLGQLDRKSYKRRPLLCRIQLTGGAENLVRRLYRNCINPASDSVLRPFIDLIISFDTSVKCNSAMAFYTLSAYCQFSNIIFLAQK